MKPIFEPDVDRIVTGSNIYGEKHLIYIKGVYWDDNLDDFVYTTENDNCSFTESYLVDEGIVLADRNYDVIKDLKGTIDELLRENADNRRTIRNLKTRLVEIKSIAKVVL